MLARGGFVLRILYLMLKWGILGHERGEDPALRSTSETGVWVGRETLVTPISPGALRENHDGGAARVAGAVRMRKKFYFAGFGRCALFMKSAQRPAGGIGLS